MNFYINLIKLSKTYSFFIIIFIIIAAIIKVKSVETDFTSLQYPEAISIAPSEKSILLKTRHHNDFELAIFDLQSKKITSIHSSKQTQLSLTWSPDSSKIIFQKKRPDLNYDLCLIEKDNLKETILNVPYSKSANLPIYWSPSGKQIAYFSNQYQYTNLYIIDIEKNEQAKFIGSFGLSPVAAWKTDGLELLVFDDLKTSEIKKFDTSGSLISQYKLGSNDKISDILWEEKNLAIIVRRITGNEFYELELLDLENHLIKKIAREPGDILKPFVINKSKDQRVLKILYHYLKEGVNSINVIDLKNGNKTSLTSQLTENILIQKINSSKLTAYGLLKNGKNPQEIISFNLKNKKIDTIYQNYNNQKLTIPEPKLVNLGAGKFKFSAYLWEPDINNSIKCGVIFVHGGPFGEVKPYWKAEIATLIKRKCIFIAPNYRGSSGRGLQFSENHTISDHVQDLTETIEFIKKSYGSAIKMVLYGESYGTRIILSSTPKFESDSQISGLLLTSSLIFDNLNVPINIKTIAIHGIEDVIYNSKNVEIFLKDKIKNNQLNFKTLKGEGHVFHMTSSHKLIIESLLKQLE
jgi:dipeptidyl aminopeptidase/acylaminoacyl peptidase